MNLASPNKVRRSLTYLKVFKLDHGQCIHGHR